MMIIDIIDNINLYNGVGTRITKNVESNYAN